MSIRLCLLPLVLCISLIGFGQTNDETRPLGPGNLVERDIAGGETHTYQIKLAARKFMRAVVEQKGIDVAVALVAPDGKRLAETNLTGAFGQESLSYEADAAGDYRIVIRTIAATAAKGAYQARVEVKAAATAEDKQRIAAERLLAEAAKLSTLGAVAAAQTLDKAQQALPIWRELADGYWEAHTLNRIGNAWVSSTKYEKAIESYNQALAKYRELKKLPGEGMVLNNLGIAYQGLSRYAKAIEYFEQAAAIRHETKDRDAEADSLNSLGDSYERLSRHDKAIQNFESALAINREIKNRRGEGANLFQIGWTNYELGRHQKAVEYCGQALLIAREVKNRDDEAEAITGLGSAYSGLKQYDKAIEYHEQARAIFRDLKERGGEASALNNLAIAYLGQLRYEKAIEYFELALTIFRETNYRQAEALALRNIGDTYMRITRLDKVAENYEKALVIYRDLNDRQGEAKVLGPLAWAYITLGRPEKGMEYFEQALPINREFKNRFRESGNLNGLGLANEALGRHEKAIEFYEQALAVARENKIRGQEGTVLGNIGEAYLALGRYDKAVEYSEQALVIDRETAGLSSEAEALDTIGSALRAQALYSQAVERHEQALAIARQIRSRRSEGNFLNNLMLDWKAQSRPRLAVFYGKQAVNLYQTIRGEITQLEKETQESYVKSVEDVYRTLADLLISDGRLPEAEQVINLLKQQEYFDFIRRDSSSAPQAEKAPLTPEEAALEKRYREIADQLAALGVERGTLMDKKSRTPEEEQRLAKLDADLVVAGNAFQKFLDQLTTELGTSNQSSGNIFQLRESQGLMEDLRELGKGVVAVYTLVGEGKYRVILTTADFQKGYEYPIKAADLNRKVLEFREVLQNPKYDPLPLAQELYKILLGPVARDLEKARAQTVMWSLDGVLRYVPVAALHDGKQYLVERFRNVVFTPASQARLKDAPARNWDALGLGVSKAHGERIPALPGVLDEMRGIVRDESAAKTAAGNQTGVLPGVVKLDEEFTQDAMLAELRKRHKVVHIASHFQFSPGNETSSALLLGDGTFLSMAQIKSLPNVFGGVELLTLSACNTATGGSGANGKEVEGFGVLAQRQGAKAVVASLWPVFDTSTKLLMQDFYRLREAKQDTTKAEALRQAQLRLLHGETTNEAANVTMPDRQIVHEDAPVAASKPRFTVDPKKPYAHPYYWAPFILIGNWK